MLIKENRKKLKIIIMIIIIMVFILSLVCLYRLSKLLEKEIYKPSSNVTNIEKERKKDDIRYYKTTSWLKVQGTNIDAPIINYYYEETEEESRNSHDDDYINKTNYLWNQNGEEKLFNKVNIMGHNILNLSAHPDSGLKNFSRFDDLMSFVYYDFVKENKYIEYTINKKDYIYKIYSVEFINYDNLDKYIDSNYTKKEMSNFIKESKKNSLYDFDVDINENDKIISLITCTRFFGDNHQINFRVNARLVRNDERLTNYNVKKNKNYSKIEKKLEGDDVNEKA